MAERKLALRTDYQPAVITADFDGMKARLAELMEPYKGMDDGALAQMERKELSRLRSDVNGLIKSVEDGRKAVKRAYNEPLAAFEARVRELLEPAKAASEQLKAHIDRKDELKRQGYREALEGYFAEVAGELAGVVPFERMFEPDWVASDAKYKAAFDALLDKCSRLAADWDALKHMRSNLFDYDECERELFRTFDLRAATAMDEQRRQEAERLAAMKGTLAPAEPEPAEPQYYEPPEFQEVGPEPAAPAPMEPQIAGVDPMAYEPSAVPDAPPEPVFRWSAEFTATRSQKESYKQALRSLGIHGTLKCVGEVG